MINIKLQVNQLLDKIRVDFDLSWKITMGGSIFMAILSLLFTNFDFITSFLFVLEFLILVWFFIQHKSNFDETYINDMRFRTILVFFLSIETVLVARGLDTLAKEILLFVCFYSIITISLNMCTGMVGVVNFGVVAQVAVGSVTFGVLTVNYNFSLFIAAIFAMLASAIFSGLIGITTLKLRDDYFAIVSVTIGEIFRQILKTEPMTRGPFVREGVPPSTPGILNIPQPFKESFDNFMANSFLKDSFLDDLGYRFFLGLIGIVLVLVIYLLSNKILYSPYGRILKSIREDEDVASTYGKYVFRYKVEILTISGAIAGLGGVYMTWIFLSIFPENFVPIMTFFAWTVLIVGGTGNNKGVIVGAITFIMLERMSLRFNDQGSILVSSLNAIVGALNPNAPRTVSVAYFQLLIIGIVLILFLRYAPRGIIPEERYRPTIRGVKLPPPGSQSEKQKGENQENHKGGNN